MPDGLKVTDTEKEFLELMGIKLENGKISKKNSKEDFKFLGIYKERPHSRTDVVYVYSFKSTYDEVLFFRKDDKPTLESLVLKRNGEKYIMGEEYTENDYPKRFITFVGREPEYYNTKIHVVSKPYINGRYFYETKLLYEFGTAKNSTTAKFGPEDALDNEIYRKKYDELINSELDESKEAREFFSKVFSYFNNGYKACLEIPIIYSNNFFNSMSNEENKANDNYDQVHNFALKERNERLLDIRERRQLLQQYIESKASTKGRNSK